jgi:hypothetical protein
VAKPLIQDLLAALELAAIIAAQIEQPRAARLVPLPGFEPGFPP